MRDLLLIGTGFLLALIVLRYLQRPAPLATFPREAENTETWEWVDWRGQKRQVTIHRHIRFH